MSSASEYLIERWERPERLPGGVAIPTTSRREFYHYFMNIDERIWEMTQSQRETWKNEIINNWEEYRLVLYRDGTGAFHQQLKDMHRMGGAIILVAGDMGVGKSIISMSLTKIWNVLNKNKNPIHIFWSKEEVRAKIRRTAPNTAHSIDEDMKATGSGSTNLEIHLKNLFESIRKTGKLILYTGVNAQPSRLGRAVGLQLFPIGFNRQFQANRFIVCNWKGEPLWIAFTQRFYFPEEKAYYEGELGLLGEYASRVLEFSNTMSGVFAGSNAQQEKTWSNELVKHWQKEWPDDNKPSMDVLEFEAIQIEIPQESTASIRRVCAYSKKIIEKSSRGKTSKGEKEGKPYGEFSEDWKGLRDYIESWCHRHEPARKEYAKATALWIVPEDPPLSQDDVFDLIDFGKNPVKSGTLAREIRKLRKRIQRPDREFTDFTESWVASQLDTLGAKKLGGQNRADIVVPVGEQLKHIAVKFCVRNDPFYDYTVTPETDGVVVIIIPRKLQFFIIPIKGNVIKEHLQLDNTTVREQGSLVGIEDLGKAISKLMLVSDNDKEDGGDKK